MGATENGVFTLGREADIELEAGAALPWLSNRGHLNPMLAGVVPETNFGILSTMHQRLGGDENLLAGKRAGSSPRPDFVLPESCACQLLSATQRSRRRGLTAKLSRGAHAAS